MVLWECRVHAVRALQVNKLYSYIPETQCFCFQLTAEEEKLKYGKEAGLDKFLSRFCISQTKTEGGFSSISLPLTHKEFLSPFSEATGTGLRLQ